MASKKEISFLITTNYDAKIIKRSVSLTTFRIILAVVGLVIALVAAGLVLAGASAQRMTRLAYLEYRNSRLEAEFAKLVMLRRRLAELEEQSKRMAEMLGVERTPPEVNWDAPALSAESGRSEMRVLGDLPTIVPLDEYVLSRGFSSRHQAVDLAARSGTAVHAAARGVVADLGTDTVFGKYVLLRHAEGYETYYAHLSLWRVKTGDSVRAGQVVGAVGSTGQSSAPHLHFEIRRYGQRIDPTGMMKF